MRPILPLWCGDGCGALAMWREGGAERLTWARSRPGPCFSGERGRGISIELLSWSPPPNDMDSMDGEQGLGPADSLAPSRRAETP